MVLLQSYHHILSMLHIVFSLKHIAYVSDPMLIKKKNSFN